MGGKIVKNPLRGVALELSPDDRMLTAMVMFRIAVVDGQGGGIGKNLIQNLKDKLDNRITVVALGTNALATSTMIKAGADEGATGENAIVQTVARVDLIVGPIGIVVANSMLGELTPKMAEAIGSAPCRKILIPVQKCSVSIAGSENKTMQNLVDDLILQVKEIIKD